MRLLYLDRPHLVLALEAEKEELPGLVVVGGRPWEQAEVLDFSPAAGRLGVRRGQPLGTAHRLVPDARFLPADLPAYRARLTAAIEALAAFTPSLEADDDPAGPAFGRLLLGIEGLHLLWGEEPELARRLLAALAGVLPGRPRLGIGNSRFGAQVAAVVGARRAVRSRERSPGERLPRGAPAPAEPIEAIPVGGPAAEAAYLAPLPIGLLPADEAISERLRVFGLTRIGQFAAISRSAVVARFGEPGGLLHDLARGLDGRPLRPRRPVERLRAEAQLEPPVEELEPLRFVLRRLCGALCEQLAARGAGAGRAVLELEIEGAPARLRLEQPLPEASAAAELVERLLLARLAAQLPSAPVAGICLELDRAAPAAGQQLGLFTPQLARAARLDWQLAGLALRFGADRIWQARILDPAAALAEQRFEWRPATAEPLSR